MQRTFGGAPVTHGGARRCKNLDHLAATCHRGSGQLAHCSAVDAERNALCHGLRLIRPQARGSTMMTSRGTGGCHLDERQMQYSGHGKLRRQASVWSLGTGKGRAHGRPP